MKLRKLTTLQIILATSILGILTGFLGGLIYRDERPGLSQLKVKLEMMDAINTVVEQREIAWARCGRCHNKD